MECKDGGEERRFGMMVLYHIHLRKRVPSTKNTAQKEQKQKPTFNYKNPL